MAAGALLGVLLGVLVAWILVRGKPERVDTRPGPRPLIRSAAPRPAARRAPAPPPAVPPKPSPPAPGEALALTPAPPPSDYIPRFKYCQGFPAPGEPGRLRNASFEGWERRGAPLSWDVNGQRQLGYRIEHDDVRDGERCLKVIDRSVDAQGKLWQQVRDGGTLAGRKVRFSVWVKLLDGPKKVDYLSIFTPETGHVFIDDPPITPGRWEQVSVETKLPEDTSKVVVYVSCFSAPNTGEMLVDGARFDRLPPAGPGPEPVEGTTP